ncbi:hypothetical protein [Burkholderia stabilis]|uniref:hypothetical protein n=1 Tax=Burkholderia stabilis TaxID=95485 RepID=UPI001590D2A9|nr:hypothetical protein [Burkholderia stabilis]
MKDFALAIASIAVLALAWRFVAGFGTKRGWGKAKRHILGALAGFVISTLSVGPFMQPTEHGTSPQKSELPRATASAMVASAPSALAQPARDASLSTPPSINALPFTIEGASLSNLFQDNLKVSKIQVGVSGGTAAEWAATAIAIAEKAATFGANSIDVSVRRNEITQSRGTLFREVARVSFSPDPKRTVWAGEPQWSIQVADPEHLSTQRDVQITEAYYAENERLLDAGLADDVADRKAGAAVAKKFHLAKDWRMPIGNAFREVPRDSINFDAAPASDGLAMLTRCLKGKIVVGLTTCTNL